MRMEKDWSRMSERILNFTLEIIYLLTGEDYVMVEKTSGHYLTPNNKAKEWNGNCGPMTECERRNDKKILEVTQKIIELLTGEVPIRCQDVTVYFSMEEWEYVEGNKDLYKDVMMEDQLPLTSPDASRNKNTSERCLRPLYSGDSTQEHHEISKEHHEIHQVRPFHSQDFTREHHEVPKAHPLHSLDSSRGHHEILQTCPLYSWDSTQEHHEIPQDDQNEIHFDIKVEVKKEEECLPVTRPEPCRVERTPPEIGTDELHHRMGKEKRSLYFPDDDVKEEDATSDSSEGNLNHANFHTVPLGAHLISSSSPYLPVHLRGGGRYHPPKFPCPKFACSQCGRTFTLKTNLVAHQKLHSGEKPYSCLNCGKSFSRSFNLIRHQRIHTGEKPYSCSDCGKVFNNKSNLRTHQKTHANQKSYLCSHCGISFTEEYHLVDHLEAHFSSMVLPCNQYGK